MPIILTEEKEKEKEEGGRGEERGREGRGAREGLGRPVHGCTQKNLQTHTFTRMERTSKRGMEAGGMRRRRRGRGG